MARALTQTFRDTLDAIGANSHDLLDLTLDNGVQLHLATGRVYVAGIDYVTGIDDPGEVGYAEGSAPDGGKLTLFNHEEEWGDLTTDLKSVLSGAHAVFSRVLWTGTVWEADVLATGKVYVTNVTETAVDLSFVPDTAANNRTVGATPVTQRCPKKFNKGGGVPTPDTAPCGWRLSQGGDPNFCDHEQKSAQGCTGHNNEPRCGAVETNAPESQAALARIVAPDPDALPNGYPRGAYPGVFDDPRLDRGYYPVAIQV